MCCTSIESRGATTNDRAASVCGATKLTTVPSTPHAITGPPLDKLYAVEPTGVASTMPSHATVPISSSEMPSAPTMRQPSSFTRPVTPPVATTSLTAVADPRPARSTSRPGSCTVRYSPLASDSTARSRESCDAPDRTPRAMWRVSSITPSSTIAASQPPAAALPPSASTSALALDSRSCFSASTGSQTRVMPTRSATLHSTSTARPATAGSRWVTTYRRRTASMGGIVLASSDGAVPASCRFARDSVMIT